MNWTWTIKSCSKNTWLNSMTMAILTNVRRSWRQEVKWWLWCVCVNIMFVEVHQTCTEFWGEGRKLSWGITAILAIYNSGTGGDTLELRSFRKLMKDNQYQLNLCSPPLLIGRICECTHTHDIIINLKRLMVMPDILSHYGSQITGVWSTIITSLVTSADRPMLFCHRPIRIMAHTL